MNCRSLTNKKGPLYNLIDSSRPDIIIATETWLSDAVHSSEYFSSQYEVHRRDRDTSTTGGGVLIAVNSAYTSQREDTFESETSVLLWVKVKTAGCKHLYIGAGYRAAPNDAQFNDALDNTLTKISGKNNNTILLGGDFNLPGWDWKANSLKPKTPYPAIHHRFSEVISDHGLTQIVKEPTRGDNTLDLIAANRPNQINRTQVFPGLSDHDAVYTE